MFTNIEPTEMFKYIFEIIKKKKTKHSNVYTRNQKRNDQLNPLTKLFTPIDVIFHANVLS